MPELEQKKMQKRYVAYKLCIADIIKGEFVKDEFSAGYIKFNKINVFRTNIIATIVYKSEDVNYTSAVIDDGTAKISLRSFENTNAFSKVDVGDMIMVIGRLREFNDEKYIVPEILNKVNNAEWMNVWKLQWIKKNFFSNNEKSEEVAKEGNEEMFSLIKRLDSGDGVYIDEVVKNSDNAEAEVIINKMLESGDIFEVKPGKIKILE